MEAGFCQIQSHIHIPYIQHSYIGMYTYVQLHTSSYVTGLEKTGLIYTKYTYSYYGAYLFFSICYPNSVSFIAFLRILCIYDEFVLKCYVAKMRYYILKTEI